MGKQIPPPPEEAKAEVAPKASQKGPAKTKPVKKQAISAAASTGDVAELIRWPASTTLPEGVTDEDSAREKSKAALRRVPAAPPSASKCVVRLSRRVGISIFVFINLTLAWFPRATPPERARWAPPALSAPVEAVGPPALPAPRPPTPQPPIPPAQVYVLLLTGEVFDAYPAYLSRLRELTARSHRCPRTGAEGLTYVDALRSARDAGCPASAKALADATERQRALAAGAPPLAPINPSKPGGGSRAGARKGGPPYVPDPRPDYVETLDEARSRLSARPGTWRHCAFRAAEAAGTTGRTVADCSSWLLDRGILPTAATAAGKESGKEAGKEASKKRPRDGDLPPPESDGEPDNDGGKENGEEGIEAPTGPDEAPADPARVAALRMGEARRKFDAALVSAFSSDVAFCRTGRGLWALRAMSGVAPMRPDVEGRATGQPLASERLGPHAAALAAAKAAAREAARREAAQKAAERKEAEAREREERRAAALAAKREAARYPIDDADLLTELVSKWESGGREGPRPAADPLAEVVLPSAAATIAERSAPPPPRAAVVAATLLSTWGEALGLVSAGGQPLPSARTIATLVADEVEATEAIESDSKDKESDVQLATTRGPPMDALASVYVPLLRIVTGDATAAEPEGGCRGVPAHGSGEQRCPGCRSCLEPTRTHARLSYAVRRVEGAWPEVLRRALTVDEAGLARGCRGRAGADADAVAAAVDTLARGPPDGRAHRLSSVAHAAVLDDLVSTALETHGIRGAMEMRLVARDRLASERWQAKKKVNAELRMAEDALKELRRKRRDDAKAEALRAEAAEGGASAEDGPQPGETDRQALVRRRAAAEAAAERAEAARRESERKEGKLEASVAEKKRKLERIEARHEREVALSRLRAEPLGIDRAGVRYWRGDDVGLGEVNETRVGSSTPSSELVVAWERAAPDAWTSDAAAHAESTWGRLVGRAAVANLVKSLDTRGKRELALCRALQVLLEAFGGAPSEDEEKEDDGGSESGSEVADLAEEAEAEVARRERREAAQARREAQRAAAVALAAERGSRPRRGGAGAVNYSESALARTRVDHSIEVDRKTDPRGRTRGARGPADNGGRSDGVTSPLEVPEDLEDSSSNKDDGGDDGDEPEVVAELEDALPAEPVATDDEFRALRAAVARATGGSASAAAAVGGLILSLGRLEGAVRRLAVAAHRHRRESLSTPPVAPLPGGWPAWRRRLADVVRALSSAPPGEATIPDAAMKSLSSLLLAVEATARAASDNAEALDAEEPRPTGGDFLMSDAERTAHADADREARAVGADDTAHEGRLRAPEADGVLEWLEDAPEGEEAAALRDPKRRWPVHVWLSRRERDTWRDDVEGRGVSAPTLARLAYNAGCLEWSLALAEECAAHNDALEGRRRGRGCGKGMGRR